MGEVVICSDGLRRFTATELNALLKVAGLGWRQRRRAIRIWRRESRA
jgi:hypothetical protein